MSTKLRVNKLQPLVKWGSGAFFTYSIFTKVCLAGLVLVSFFIWTSGIVNP